METHLYRAMRLYGIDNFTLEILEEVAGDINAREIYWIETLRPEYNMTTGGDGGDTSWSPNYRKGISRRDTSGSRNSMFGKRGDLSPNKGKKRTEDQKRRLRNGLLDAWKTNPKRREKMSLALRGLDNNPGAKKSAKRVCFEGVEYASLAEASRRTLRSIQFIRKNCEFL
jgi:hypothetical protein